MRSTSGAGDVEWDEQYFRSVLGHFCSGFTIVTAQNETGPMGLTCQSFFSVSLDPPLIAKQCSRVLGVSSGGYYK